MLISKISKSLKKSLLITGSGGFLGKALMQHLSDTYDVKGISRNSNAKENFQLIDWENLNQIKLAPDFIVMTHAAVASGSFSPSDEELFEVNVKKSLLLRNRFPESKIVYISTCSVYTTNSEEISEYSNLSPQSKYAETKLKAECELLSRGLCKILRISSLFGIGMKENTIIPIYVNQALNHGEIEIWGKGTRVQNYISIVEAVQFISSMIEHFDNLKSEVFLGVASCEHSNAELAAMIASKTGALMRFSGIDASKSYHFNNKLSRELLGISTDCIFEKELNKYIEWKQKQSLLQA